MMREYNEKERLCQKCGQSGHIMMESRKDCVCKKCKIPGNKCDHPVLSDACPEYVRALERKKQGSMMNELCLNIVV